MTFLLSTSIIKIATVCALSFLAGCLATPWLLGFMRKHQLWRKQVRQTALGGGDVPIFQKFHQEGEIHVPRFGGVIIWLIPPIVTFSIWILSFSRIPFLENINFLTRSETWLPLGTLIIASFVGFLDDLLQVILPPTNTFLKFLWEKLNNYAAGGLSLKHRFTLITLIGLAGAWWFYYKLGWDTIHIPGDGDIFLGWLIIPFFVLVMLATYSGGVIDGVDGLSGGVFATMFTSYGLIAISQGQIDLATLCFAIVGTLLAFLWSNIPPAKFYMGEVGMMGLTATLTVVAFLTDSVLVLPIIGLLLVLESGSVILQLLSKKLRHGKKIFLAAPFHHHLEALGWGKPQITMRLWIISIVCAFVGVAIKLLG